LQGEFTQHGPHFRQASDFFYCCGVEIIGAMLLMSGADRKTTLYVPHRPADKHPDEVGLRAEDAEIVKAFTGVDEVCGTEALAGHLGAASTVFIPHMPAERLCLTRWTAMGNHRRLSDDLWDGRPAPRQHFIALLKTRFPKIVLRELDPVLDGLRAVKSAREIAVMREAGRLSALAVTEAMRFTRPGMLERQLSALASYIYLAHGAIGEGYQQIVASGRNMQFGHYSRNNAVLQDGDIVLMDSAPDYKCYTSDIGRTWPVSGVYATWQRELYGYIVKYQQTLLGLLRPGLMADDILKTAAERMAGVIASTGFSKKIYEESARRTLEFKGHLSHPVGLSVHDVGPYRHKPLEPGVVLSVDAMMWVPEEQLYIRCEDTVVITADGIENFTAAAPLDPDAIEAVMREDSAYPSLF
jgi:Xaa-Pro aminopeptidase